jgi:FkbM family methyltransferase
MQRKSASSGPANLVFDIGLNNGDDTAYYVHLGLNVVGVEANPLLAAACSRRFEHEIGTGQVKVVNLGIWGQPGDITFHRNLQDDQWSTFEPGINQMPGEWEQLTIPCITTQQLIAEHGQPYFIKVDIEGSDFQVLKTLTPATAPDYISLELNSTDPFVERLIALGYNAFKFVDGETFRHSPPIFKHQIGWRLLRKTGRVVPVFDAMMRKLPESLRPKREWSPPGKHGQNAYAFTDHSSGPFGEHADGPWLTPEAAQGWLTKLKRDLKKAGQEKDIWWDVHARHPSAQG